MAGCLNQRLITSSKVYNEKRAFSYWRNAELLNDPEALEFIAQCFEKGLLGQAVNSEAALDYRTRALEARKYLVIATRIMY